MDFLYTQMARKKSFFVSKVFDKDKYSFWGRADNNVAYMSVSFQFHDLAPLVEHVFKRYCNKKDILLQKIARPKGLTGFFYYRDMQVSFEFLGKENATKISFTRKYQKAKLDHKDFLYFKNMTRPFFGFISNYKEEGASMIKDFQTQQYTSLMDIVNGINISEAKELLVEEMAFLLRCKDEPKKVRLTVQNIRRYAKVLNYDPEEFLKKELGKNYFF